MQRFLFDRLCQPQQSVPKDEQSRLAWLRQSIAQELQRLFGQRAFFDGLDLQADNRQAPCVLNYGLNDLVSRSANFEDTHACKEELRKAIQHYEPRLHNPHISLIATNDPLMPAQVQISGVIKTELLEDEFSWKQGSI